MRGTDKFRCVKGIDHATPCKPVGAHSRLNLPPAGVRRTGGGGAGLPTVTPGKFHPFSKAAARCYHYCRFNITPEKAVFKAVCVARGDKINHPAKIPDINVTGKVIDRCELLPRR